MARKEKFTKEDILNKSVLYVKEFGIDRLTVRDLANFIGCSTQPIFRFYSKWNDFKIDLKEYLYNDYKEFISSYVNVADYLMTISYAYAMYSKVEPNIFKALFISDLSDKKDKNKKELIESLKEEYNISDAKAESVYRDVSIYTKGLATNLCFKNMNISDKDLLFLINNCIKRNIKS
mgnify:CR=1 FL=1